MRIVSVNSAFDPEMLPGKLFLYDEDKLGQIQPLSRFKAKHAKYIHPSWQYDVVKSATRLFAFIDAARDYKGLSVFIDPSLKIKERLTEDLFRRELGRNYIGLFKRDGLPSKPDIFMVDGEYPEHHEFMEFVASILEDEMYTGLSYWTEGAILDEAVKRYSFPVKNLSGVFGKEKDPIKMTAFAQYVDL